MTAALSRRSLVAGVLACGIAPARAAGEPRIVALDWGWASTLIAMGGTPVGVAEQRLYADWVRTPALPAGVVEVGLRTNPSFEALVALKPDLILTNPLNEIIRTRLERIAPTLDNPTYTASATPLASAKAAARALSMRIGRQDAAEAVVAQTEDRIARARLRLGENRWTSLLPVTIVDRRHLVLYGRGSLFTDVLLALGLRNDFAEPTSLWGTANRAVADLGSLRQTDVLVVEPIPPAADRLLKSPSLLTSLLAAKGDRAYRLPPAWSFGDLTAGPASPSSSSMRSPETRAREDRRPFPSARGRKKTRR